MFQRKIHKDSNGNSIKKEKSNDSETRGTRGDEKLSQNAPIAFSLSATFRDFLRIRTVHSTSTFISLRYRYTDDFV